MQFLEAAQLSEDQAREYLEGLRWPNGPICPHCGSDQSVKLNGKATRPGVHKCKDSDCRKQFTVTVGTIFERSHIPLRKWIMAFCLVCSSKKGISALQLQRMLDLKSYKSAWHMAHRIRFAMTQEPLKGMLGGKGKVVEADETWIGARRPTPGGPNRWQDNKVAVMALVERGGSMRAKAIGRVTKDNLREALHETVDSESDLHTDGYPIYRRLSHHFRSHESVDHTKGEYSRGNVHCNSAEAFFALLKRGVHGTFHHVGKNHLGRYCEEFSFRWNSREMTDADRTEAALKAAPGKRLTYRSPVANATML